MSNNLLQLQYPVKAEKSNHPGENLKMVALCRWLYFTESLLRVMSQSYVHSILRCYKPNLHDFRGFLFGHSLEAVFYMRKTCNISKYIHKLGNLVVLKVLDFYCSAIAYNVELNAGPGHFVYFIV